MKLYAKILDRKLSRYQGVVLCQFKDKDNNKVFVEELIHPCGISCFYVVLDEGYMRTSYYYPINRYSIVSLVGLKE